MEPGFKAETSQERDAPRQNLAISAYRQLKHDIIRGRYAPEQKLLMSRLKEQYGASTGHCGKHSHSWSLTAWWWPLVSAATG